MVAPAVPHAEDRPIEGLDDLVAIFHGAEKPHSEFRIGAEAEKLAVLAPDFAPLSYEGPRSVQRLFAALHELGWELDRESADGPVIALNRGAANITLEPGSQFELSGSALPDLHQVADELAAHLRELAPISSELGLSWLGVGFHPLAKQEELSWVPKRRYAIMREYLPPLGAAAHDMMRRTATVQANFDFSNEADALKKLMVALKLSPIIHAMFANSPFKEGRVSELLSVRGEVWLDMDPARSGLIPALWHKPSPGYVDYVEWALDAGMFLFKRAGEVVANTGQTFRSFWRDGFNGHTATVSDFRLHLQTLFPEARLKNTLEVRACDSLPLALQTAVAALFTGIFYDARSLDQAAELAAPLDIVTVSHARPELVRRGLSTKLGAVPAVELAQKLFEIALSGLERRALVDASGADERRHLAPLSRFLEHGESPAHEVIRGLRPGDAPAASDIIARCHI